MATPQETVDAAAIMEARGWGVTRSTGGWAIQDRRGRRVWPQRTSELVADPWIGVIEADTAIGVRAENHGIRATRAIRELEQGAQLRPVTVTEPDPGGGPDIEVLRWDLLNDSGAVVLGRFASAFQALEARREARGGGR